MVAFIYLCILLFMIIFSLYLIYLNSSKCPIKIRKFYLVSLLIIVMRYLSLLSLWLIQRQRVIYSIKILTHLNFVAIPLLILAAIYIFLRDEKRKFDYNYIVMIILFLGYFIINAFYKLDIRVDTIFGFIVNYKVLTPNLIYLIVISSFVIITILFVDKQYSNTCGMRLLLISLIITVIEFIIFLGGFRIFPYPLVGEMCIIGCSYKAISTFKIKK
ncbi:hypothetical protein [uncultured Clostridium sp.]|uniref:hypothetical protein n=3 Tax=uncultured Clostridium sp. TaxID=59620 RepID=UPI002617240D|nr:hypothetical protein [uncultured Clostridium sp.]